MTWRALSVIMLGSALASIIYIGTTGERWPLAFAGAMVAGSLIVIPAELLHDRRNK